MPRRERQLGIVPIENDKERDVTFYKRRSGLFKGASDLSVLTGARVAIVLATENGKIHSFGTSSAKPIVDAFLSGTAPPVDEVKEAKIAWLQRKVARLDMETTIKDKRNKVCIQKMKKVQDENPGMVANLVLSKEEDLSLEDLYKLFNELLRVKEDTQSRFPLFYHGHEATVGGQSSSTNMLPHVGISNNHMQTTCLSQQSSWSHHLSPQQPFLLVPPTLSPEQNLAPHHIAKEPQILRTVPSALAPPLTSLLQPIPDPVEELPPPQDLHLQYYPSMCNRDQQPPHNYEGPNISFKHTLENSALLANSGVNDFAIDGFCGYDSWGYPLSDNAYHNGIPGVDGYLGYNGTNVGQSRCFNAPPGYF
jgi:hypothetical protein